MSPKQKYGWTNIIIVGAFVVVAGAGLVLSLTSNGAALASKATINSQETLINPDIESNGIQGGQTAPDFALQKSTGGEVTLASLKGKPTMLVFETTWCHFCQQEGPDTEKFFETYKDKIHVVSIDAREDAATVNASITKRGFTRPFLLDQTGEVGISYAVAATPTHYFLDSDGKIVGMYPGLLTYEQLQQVAEKLL